MKTFKPIARCPFCGQMQGLEIPKLKFLADLADGKITKVKGCLIFHAYHYPTSCCRKTPMVLELLDFDYEYLRNLNKLLELVI